MKAKARTASGSSLSLSPRPEDEEYGHDGGYDYDYGYARGLEHDTAVSATARWVRVRVRVRARHLGERYSALRWWLAWSVVRRTYLFYLLCCMEYGEKLFCKTRASLKTTVTCVGSPHGRPMLDIKQRLYRYDADPAVRFEANF